MGKGQCCLLVLCGGVDVDVHAAGKVRSQETAGWLGRRQRDDVIGRGGRGDGGREEGAGEVGDRAAGDRG